MTNLQEDSPPRKNPASRLGCTRRSAQRSKRWTSRSHAMLGFALSATGNDRRGSANGRRRRRHGGGLGHPKSLHRKGCHEPRHDCHHHKRTREKPSPTRARRKSRRARNHGGDATNIRATDARPSSPMQQCRQWIVCVAYHQLLNVLSNCTERTGRVPAPLRPDGRGGFGRSA